MTSPLFAFDYPLEKFLTQFAGQSNAFDSVLFAISDFDTFKGVILFSLLWFAWFLQKATDAPDDRTRRRVQLLIVFFGTLLAVAVARLLQKFLGLHPRPLHMDLGLTFPHQVDVEKLNAWNSFPSDHAVYFFALATGLWSIDKRLALFAGLWTLFGVLLPRIYLGIHHPSDVIAGTVIGIVLMLVLQKIELLHTLARRVLNWSERHQGLFYWLAFLFTINAAHLFDDLREMSGQLRTYFLGG